MGAQDNKVRPTTKKESKAYGVPVGATSVDQRTRTAMNEAGAGVTGGIDPATKIANDWWSKLMNQINNGSGNYVDFGSGSGSGSAGSNAYAARLAIAKMSAEATARNNKLINDMLNKYATTASNNADTRYNQYLANLNAAQGTANKSITDASNALVESIPKTYTPAVVAPVVTPQAATNAYQQYLQSMGVNTSDVGNLQQYANMQNAATTNLLNQSTAAHNAAQQDYLNALRTNASQMGVNAQTKLAQQIATLQAQAAQANKTTHQNILSSLLPYLVSHPSGNYANALAGL